MTGLLVVLALIGAILWVFTRMFRARVRSQLRGQQLPEELRQAATPAPASRSTPATAVRPGATPAATAASGRGPHFLLIYEVGPDFTARREPHRDAHLALAWKAAAAGELLLAGALEEPAGQAFLLFAGRREAAERFARADPYVQHGLVRQWQVRQWHTVVGNAAAQPQRPRPRLEGAPGVK